MSAAARSSFCSALPIFSSSSPCFTSSTSSGTAFEFAKRLSTSCCRLSRPGKFLFAAGGLLLAIADQVAGISRLRVASSVVRARSTRALLGWSCMERLLSCASPEGITPPPEASSGLDRRHRKASLEAVATSNFPAMQDRLNPSRSADRMLHRGCFPTWNQTAADPGWRGAVGRSHVGLRARPPSTHD